jgi:hypothetical protein
MFEDLADRQLSQYSHCQDHPTDYLMSEFAPSLIDSPSGYEGLANSLRRDNLFESRQSIQNPARFIGRQRALSS